MYTGVAFIVIGWIVVMVLIVRAVVRVPDDQAFVVKRLGRVHQVLEPGMHFVVPIISSIAAKISTLEQVHDVPVRSCVLRDGTPVSFRGTVTIRVANPALATSEVRDYRSAITGLAATEWTRALGESELSGALAAVQSAEAPIRTTAATWGLDVLATGPLLLIDDVQARDSSAPPPPPESESPTAVDPDVPADE